MGTVFFAPDLTRGHRVAVKLMALRGQADVERFDRECRTLAATSHPGVVRHLAHGALPDGRRYPAMEWVEGETVARRPTGSYLLGARPSLTAP